MTVTKVKINLEEGLIELEGSEEFVQKNLDEFKVLEEARTKISQQLPIMKQKIKPKRKQKKRKDFPKTISFDVGEKDGNPDIKKFLEKKGDPVVHFDLISCIAYYIDKYVPELTEFEEGHALYAYKHLRKNLPLNFHQAFLDTKNQRMWIENGSSDKKWKISYDGKLHVEGLSIRNDEKK